MTALPLQEGGACPLTDLLPSTQSAEDREALRSAIARLGARLRVELGLRQDAFLTEDGAEGPMLRTRGVAGTISLGRLTFDIRPKHVFDPADTTWQHALAVMLQRSARRRIGFSRTRRLQFRPRTFIDQLAMGLALELGEATRHLEVRAYRSERAELPQLRGRLLVSDQLRSALLKPHKVVCEVDELSADNAVNHFLHWAAQQLSALATQPRVRHELSVQAGRLPSVNQPVKAPTRLAYHLPRQYHHYAGAVALATAFAKGLTTAHGASNVGGAGFLVGTERLFESFIERSLEVALAGSREWQVSAQVRSLFATPIDPTGRDRSYFSKPDNVIRHGEAVSLLVDAKYKRFDDEADASTSDRPTHGDLYQTAAACVAHDCGRALLVYPRMSNRDPDRDWVPRWWQITFGDQSLMVGAVTVPLHLLAADDGLAEFDRRLRTLVELAASRHHATPLAQEAAS